MSNYHDDISKLYPYQYERKLNHIQTLQITFQITDNCNLQCSYCYQILKNKHKMSFETAKNFIDLLMENNSSTQRYVDINKSDAVILDFIGGEPFLEIDLIDKIIEYFITKVIEKNHPWQYNWIIAMTSNGTLYFKENVQKFLRKWKDKLSLTISLDGNKELHDSCRKFPNGDGSYDLAEKAVKHYMKNFANGTLTDKVTLSPDNVQYTYEAIKNLISLNYKQIYMNCVYEKGWNFSHATILYYQLKKASDYLLENNLENEVYISIFEKTFFNPLPIDYTENWCGGNGRMLAVDYKGDIYPCVRYMESSLGKNLDPIKIGNLSDGIMNNPKSIYIGESLKKINRLTQSSEECIKCPIARGCAWCQAYNYQDSGNINHRATYICCMHKARALANSYFWNKQFKKHNSSNRFKLWLPDEDALKIIDKNELQLLHELEK